MVVVGGEEEVHGNMGGWGRVFFGLNEIFMNPFYFFF